MDAIAARSAAGIALEQKEEHFRLDLSGTNLRGWRFSEAKLFGANLSGANLHWADLYEANLSGAKLSAGTRITQEQLDETVAVPPEKPPIFVGDVRDAAKTEAPLNWQPRTA